MSSIRLFPVGRAIVSLFAVANLGCSDPDVAGITLALTSLTISPQVDTVAVGATRQFTVTATWNDGTTTVPLVSFTATGGSVSASGLFQAPDVAGTYLVIVAHTGGTLRDTAAVTVRASTPTLGAFTPNLPTGAGLQLIVDTRFSDFLNQQFNADNLAYNGDGRVITDNTAPHGTSVFEQFYPANSLGGGVGGSKIYDRGGRSWRSMYFSMALWVSPNYSMHSNGEKFFYPLISTNAAITGFSPINWYPVSTTPNGTAFGFEIIVTPGTAFQNQNGLAMVPKGQWSRVEIFMRMNTVGASNGVLKVWVDGGIAVDRSDMVYSNAASASVWDGITFEGIRGGGNSSTPTPAGGQLRRYNRLAFYAAP